MEFPKLYFASISFKRKKIKDGLAAFFFPFVFGFLNVMLKRLVFVQ